MDNVQLNKEQEKALSAALSSKNLFITGGAGCGKTFLITKIIEELRKAQKSVLVLAPTGTAANLIHGMTVHRAFKLGDGPAIKNNKITVHQTAFIKAADTIIIDEISMLRIDLMSSVILSIKKVEKAYKKKIQLIVCGDFYQLAPVMVAKDYKVIREYYLTQSLAIAPDEGYAFQAPEWKLMDFQWHELTKIVRQDDEEFIRNLNLLRIGDSSCIDYFNENVNYNREDPRLPYILPTNPSVDEINKDKISELQGKPVVLRDYLIDKNTSQTTTIREFVLKEGARIMFTQNDYGSASIITDITNWQVTPPDRNTMLYTNGAMGTLIKIMLPANKLIVKMDDSQKMIVVSQVSKNNYTQIIDEFGEIKEECTGVLWQYPVRAAYAFTVHKAQGQTFSGANMNPSVYGNGQLYVEMSRIRTVDGIHLLHDIYPADLKVSSVVKSFYNHEFSIPTMIKKAVGRPKKYKGSTRVMRIPEELVDAVNKMIEEYKK